jgi:hypothetical protein
MMPLTPAFLIAAAGSFVGHREQGQNRGPMIDLFLSSVGLEPVADEPGQPWCAAFVYHVGKWSHFDYAAGKSSWPLPATGSCSRLGDFAKRKDVLKAEPMSGDVFLLWSPQLVRFVHAGVITRIRACGETPARNPWYECDTIEGNTNDDGGRERWGVLAKHRIFYVAAGDRFIRWADLDRRLLAGSPIVLDPAA